MTPIVLQLFASQLIGQASNPGTGTNSVTLSGVRGPNAVTAGPNDSLFDTPANGNVQLNMNSVSDATAAQFTKGKTYKITIEEVVAVKGSDTAQ